MTARQVARRKRVIDAALELAAEGGYDAVQMRDVAATASVALGTIYRYFTSKDHLLAAALVEWSGDLQRRLSMRPQRGDTAADRVVDVVRRAHRAMERNPRLAAALITAVTSPDPAIVDYQRDMMAILTGVLSVPMEGIDDDLKEGVLRVLTHVWFSTLLHWVNGWTGAAEVGEELEKAARLLLRDA
ncbi:MAG: TetR/AcrR family transcriptional regulator, cholesterol catabolism regulator [Acidimicrobiaceae bacterium]|nr:TetR/AcrR family transcriptional regulator, cholesterol catabolism regulator [Acidimicrobiaceae bacterium]